MYSLQLGLQALQSASDHSITQSQQMYLAVVYELVSSNIQLLHLVKVYLIIPRLSAQSAS